jgi:FKBP-type peptidyl-prolyl cis-trans isomerase FklB
MKKHLVLVLSLALAAVPAVAEEQPSGKTAPKPPKKTAAAGTKAPALKTKREKTGYAVGYNNGYGLKRNLEAQSIEVDLEAVRRGFMDALTNASSALPEQEIRTILSDLQKDLDARRKTAMAKEQEQMKTTGEKNRKEGEAFLKENGAKEGVKVLPGGLQYRILSAGTGKAPSASDTVTVNYRGTLVDGTEFDSSYKRGQPATFPLNQVIKGWTEGIPLIKEGGKIQLFIPAELAYGDRSVGAIGPHSTLIFEVELISVQQAAAAGAAQ